MAQYFSVFFHLNTIYLCLLMGRYYYGTISGKFWFAVQSSDDAEHFKEGDGPHYTVNYLACGCQVNDDDEPYCKSCYESYAEHRDDANYCDEDTDDEEIEKAQPSLADEDRIQYYCDETDVAYIQTVLAELKMRLEGIDVYPERMNWRILNPDDVDGIQYAIDIPEFCPNEKLLARLCLGKQILYAIVKTGSCNMDCEL